LDRFAAVTTLHRLEEALELHAAKPVGTGAAALVMHRMAGADSDDAKLRNYGDSRYRSYRLSLVCE
jgi:hypothetical protein